MIKTNENAEKLRRCACAGKCGACQTLNLSYENELSLKMKKEIGLLGKYGHVNEIIGMEDPLHYRAKVQYLFRYNGGRITYGLYRASDGGIIRSDSCIMEHPEATAVVHTIRKLLDKFKITVYDGRRGLLRHVMVRRSRFSGELLCALVTTDEKFDNAPEFSAELVKRHPKLVSVSRIINDTDIPLWMEGEEYLLYGNGYITEELCGYQFRISSKSFAQINPTSAAVIYETAARLADIHEGDNVLDAYCGIGTVGIIASRGAGNLYGFDINPNAIENAAENAIRNGIKNAKYICADDRASHKETEAKLIGKSGSGKIKWNVILADPPRAGCGKKFLEYIISASPDKIVYISCNPETLARDIEYLKKFGKYKVREIQPVDMFPGTAHVETVVLMSRKA